MGNRRIERHTVEEEPKGRYVRKRWERRNTITFQGEYDDVSGVHDKKRIGITFYINSGEHNNTRLTPKPAMKMMLGRYELRVVVEDAKDFVSILEEAMEYALEYADEMNEIADKEKEKYINRLIKKISNGKNH